MLITQTMMVVIGGKNIKHYLSLGYGVRLYDTIKVPIKHLTKGSHYKVLVKCDYCKEIFEKTYKSLLNQRENSHGEKDCCKNCISLKTKETMIYKYGVENGMKLKSVVEKMRSVFMKKYGVRWNTLDENIRNKARDGQINMSEEKKRNKIEKAKKTMVERYGVESPFQLEKTRQKLYITQQKGSKQQDIIYEILSCYFGKNNVFKNEPYSSLSLDILLVQEGVLLDIEYDSSYWHNPNRDRKRDEFLKSNGFKILRIKSGKKIPTKSVLLNKVTEILSSEESYFEIVLNDWNEEQYINERRGDE